jgi:hypothetical protein
LARSSAFSSSDFIYSITFLHPENALRQNVSQLSHAAKCVAAITLRFVTPWEQGVPKITSLEA